MSEAMLGHDELAQACAIIRNNYTELTIEESESSIYRVHKHLRNMNPQAYEPEIVSIGPYHRGKDDLDMMEGHKRRYLLLLEREKEISLENIFSTVAALERKARKCYAEPISLDAREFVEMLVLDGCFIIELVRKYCDPDLRQTNDPIFSMDWIIVSLQRDLMLFENQIPFFVLRELDVLTGGQNQLQERLTSDIISFLVDLFPGKLYTPIGEVSLPQKIKHLLHLMHCVWIPPFDTLNIDPKIEETETKSVPPISGLDVHKEKRWRFINSVVGLREANVKFKKNEELSLFNIQFKNGTMLIPPLTIHDETEAFFRNLIAHELYDGKSILPVTDYVRFLDCLVNSSKDVEILTRLEIVENWLGDNEVVAKMVNKLRDFVTTGSGVNIFYAKTFTDVNEHCGKRINKWMAKLRRNYLHSPWAVISIVVAVVLLVLTVTQTVFSILQVV
ncbi:hypothetical protein C2S52_008063 [Perilla frutescens var. hirtella]|nr:hypothetical protein C2S52_008063 [Perilla frutescens var. hirtella]